MTARFVLVALLMFLVTRVAWRVLGGIVEGVSGSSPRNRIPQDGVQMVRDPVCGTFVIPDRAVTVAERGRHVYFCSAKCRDTYRLGHA